MIEFKTPRIEEEWGYEVISPKLKDIVIAGSIFSFREWGIPITITDLIRTQEEQDRIYKDNERYQEKPWQSVHQYGRGCDLRVHDYNAAQVEALCDFFNQWTYDSTRPDKKTCTVHNVGSGIHFHVQCLG